MGGFYGYSTIGNLYQVPGGLVLAGNNTEELVIKRASPVRLHVCRKRENRNRKNCVETSGIADRTPIRDHRDIANEEPAPNPFFIAKATRSNPPPNERGARPGACARAPLPIRRVPKECRKPRECLQLKG